MDLKRATDLINAAGIVEDPVTRAAILREATACLQEDPAPAQADPDNDDD